MNFIHEDPEFRDLLTMVGDSVGIDRTMVEKDYWVTHTLWGLAGSALEVWFKGGTSLAKGFGQGRLRCHVAHSSHLCRGGRYHANPDRKDAKLSRVAPFPSMSRPLSTACHFWKIG